MTANNEANIGLLGNKQLLLRLGYLQNGSCVTCGIKVGRESTFCGSGHDNHFLSALLADPQSGPLIRQALEIYFATRLNVNTP